jgi:signal transduction histidine kinase
MAAGGKTVAADEINPADEKKAIESLAALSDMYLRQKQYELCRETACKARDLYPDAIKTVPAVAYNIAVANMFLDNREEAAKYFRIYSDRIKENTDRNFRETIAGMEEQYEMGKKQMRISALEKERRLYVGLAILACILMLSGILFREQRIRQLRQDKALSEIRASARGIMEGEAKESERLGSELHDGVQGLLAALKLRLDDRDKAEMLTDSIIEEIRRISRNLMPETLKTSGLQAAIGEYCKAFPGTTFRFIGSNGRLPEYVKSLLFRCMQELVTNSVKHAEAKHIHVELIRNAAHVSLAVSDNGRGFDVPTAKKGMGLSGIQHRINALGGKVNIVSAPGRGTKTTIEISVES